MYKSDGGDVLSNPEGNDSSEEESEWCVGYKGCPKSCQVRSNDTHTHTLTHTHTHTHTKLSNFTGRVVRV